MDDKIVKIEKQLKQQRIVSACMALVLTAVLFSSFRGSGDQDIIKAKGIIIVDSAGRDRILIGSAIPHSADRVRDDLNKVKAAWGSKFAPQYLDWYKHYYNSASGIVFLDEKGFDRLAIGDRIPDPNIGKRIGRAAGIVINDDQGFERSGYNLININGQDRMVLGLDRKGGQEGAVMSIMEDESAGFAVMHHKKWLYLGNQPKENENDIDLFGLRICDTTKIKYDMNAIDK